MEPANQSTYPHHQGQSNSSSYDPLYHVLSGQDTSVPTPQSMQHTFGGAFQGGGPQANFDYWDPQQHQLPAFRTVANLALDSPWHQTGGVVPTPLQTHATGNVMFPNFPGAADQYPRGLSSQFANHVDPYVAIRHQGANFGHVPPAPYHGLVFNHRSSVTMGQVSHSTSRSHAQASPSSRAPSSNPSRTQQRGARVHSHGSSRSSASRVPPIHPLHGRSQDRIRRNMPDARALRTLQQTWTRDPEIRRRVSRELAVYHGSAKKHVVASASAKRSLQSVNIKDLPENEKCCPICYSDYNETTPEGIVEAPLRLPKCGHVFGDHCLKKWLSDSAVCPYCRDQLPSEEKIEKPSIADFINSLRSQGLIGESTTETTESVDDLLADIMDAHDEAEAFDAEVNTGMPTPPNSAPRPEAGSRLNEPSQSSPTRMPRRRNPSDTSTDNHAGAQGSNAESPSAAPGSQVAQAPSQFPYQTFESPVIPDDHRDGRTLETFSHEGGIPTQRASWTPTPARSRQPLSVSGSRSTRRTSARRSASPMNPSSVHIANDRNPPSFEISDGAPGHAASTMTAHQGGLESIIANPGVSTPLLNVGQHSRV